MANLKEIRNRISSVSSTMQITSAMKMVSAAKLKKAQDSINAMSPYSNKLSELIQTLSYSSDSNNQNFYTEKREIKNILLVVISSNRGLCGGFNSNIIKQTQLLIDTKYKDKKVSLITVGKKGSEILSKKNDIKSSHDEIYEDLNYEKASLIAQSIMDSFTKKISDEVVLIYNHFKNAATQIVKSESFLPIESLSTNNESIKRDYIYEPSQESVLQDLIPKSLKIKLLKALRDSIAGEHGARMTAMHKATDNATEMRDQLKLSYNKARQAAITNEILEIVGGAEALNS
jgi:F-type H+-transporting ATPase subunit gamma